MEYLKHPGRLEALIPTNTKHKQSGADPLSQWTVRRRPPLLCPARARRRTRSALRGRADRVHFKLAHVVYAPRPTTRQLTCQNQSAHETWPQCNLSRCHDRLFPFLKFQLYFHFPPNRIKVFFFKLNNGLLINF